MTIPDEAVNAAIGANYDENGGQQSRSAMINALTAAAPFLQGVKVKGRVFVVTALVQTSEKTGWRSRIIGAANIDEAIGRGLRAFEAGEQGANFCVPGAIEISAETLATAGILSAIDVAPSPRAQALEEILREVDEVERKAFAWSGSAFLNNELEGAEDADCKTELYSELCGIGNTMHWLRTKIRALSSQPVADGWLPIETAPKDGTVILAFCRDEGVVSVRFEQRHSYGRFLVCGVSDSYYGDFGVSPTHWRPLPASPEVSG